MKQEDIELSWEKALTLKDFVRNLLESGKKSTDKEFQVLFYVYGKKKINEMAQEYLRGKRDG